MKSMHVFSETSRRPRWVQALTLSLTLMGMPATAASPQTVAHVELDRYMGRWYEIAVLPNYFQRHCERNTTADYKLRNDGRVSVTNRCENAQGEIDEARGVARVTDADTNAKLEVSFVSLFGIQLFWGDYWILGLGSDYDYALIGTPSRRWGWVLARDRHPPRDRIDSWLQRFEEKGYDPQAFVLTPQGQRDRSSTAP
jgi:apolipoprotein D and lipocalin family protein